MVVLVTGAAGYIGKQVCAELLEQGHVVVATDIKKAEKFLKVPNFTESKNRYFIIPGKNIISAVKIKSVFQKAMTLLPSGENIEAVIHLAASKDVRESESEPVMYLKQNVIGTITVIDKSRYYKVPHFVFISSAAIYSDSEDILDESSAQEPESFYGYTKKVGEQLVKKFYENATILRLFNVVGATKDTGLVISNAIITRSVSAGLTRTLITLTDSGEQERDFIHVEDVAKAIVFAAINRIKGTFNIGTGIRTTMLEVVDEISKQIGEKLTIVLKKKQGGVFYSVANTTLMDQFLPSPKHNLYTIVQSEIKWQRENVLKRFK